MTDAAQARTNLRASIALALSDAEDFMAAAEAQHKAIGGDVLDPNGADQRASLSECLYRTASCACCGNSRRCCRRRLLRAVHAATWTA